MIQGGRIALAGWVGGTCLGAIGLLAEPSSVSRPNVVLFLTDDQGTLDANCYGSTDLYTPTIDSLAANGVRFTQAYAHSVCCPARAMLMTGRYPQRSGVNDWTQGDARASKPGVNMRLEEITLAEALRGAGYKTALFGKWHLGAHLDYGPTEQGFEQYFGLRGGFIDNYNHYFLHGSGLHDLYEGKKEVFAPGEYFPDLMTQRALDYIDRNKAGPFFLYVAYNIPHYPEQPDPKFDDRYNHLSMPRRSYAQMVSTVDDHMGRIMEKLERCGLREKTIVVFMSDNGFSIENHEIKKDGHTSGLPKGTYYGAHGGGGNTGKWSGNKGTFYEGGIRVPAIISYPNRLPQGVVRNQAITAMDWFPTILDLCQVPLPNIELDGKSLLPVIDSETEPSPHSVLYWQWKDNWAVLKGDWKLISGKKETLLCNLADAEPERQNHYAEKPELVAQLKALHQAWLADVNRE